MQSKATTVADYLNELAEDRRSALQAVRATLLKNLDADFEEGMQYGGIGYYVPHRIYPAGYRCDPTKPLPFAGLASQKRYMALYLMPLYGAVGADRCEGGNDYERWFRDAWAKTGKKLDMGKVCIRFKKIEDVPLDVIGEAIRRVPAKAYIATYEALLPPPKASKKKPTK
ncbi:MAG: DUF1801 domain-containing protein [Planctomycetota bacterium]